MKVSFRRFAYNVFFRFSPLLIVVLLELSLRFLGIGESYLLFQRSEDGNYQELNPLYYRRFVAAEQFGDIPILPQRFPLEKPEGSRRIFLIGDQTLCSMIPGANETQLIPDFYDRDSVFNDFVQIAAPLTNSFAMKRIVKCLNKYEADACIVVTGANEFYGIPRKSNWMQDIDNYYGLTAYVTLKNHRFLQVLDRFVYLKKEKVITFPPADIDDWAVLYGSVPYAETKSYFERNLKRMIKDAGYPLFFVSPPVNITARPYRSQFDDKEMSDADIARECTVLLANADRFSIERWIAELRAWEPETAIYYYCLAMINEREGNNEAALENYRRALERDIFKARIDPGFTDVIESQTAGSSAALIDLRKIMTEAASGGLKVQKFFQGPLTLNARGKQLFADTVLEALRVFRGPANDIRK